MRINEAAELCLLPKKTIKYYEEEQLIIPKRNTTNNYREYCEEDIRVLREIKLLRKLGFSIGCIRIILNNPDELKVLFENHIKEVDNNINSMKKTKDICLNILTDNNKSESVDFANYLEKISNMEQEGYKFMDENIKEKKFKKDSNLTIFFISIFVLLIIASTIFLKYKNGVGIALFATITVGSLVFLVARHSRTTAYICKKCNKKFTIGFFIDLLSLQIPNKKYLKCPHCGKWAWAKESYRD